MQITTFQATGNFQGLTRPETIQAMDLTINQLNHFEKMGWVVPKRFGNGRNRVVMYDFKALIQLQFIKSYREKYGKEIVENVLKFIDETEDLKLNAWILVNKDEVNKEEMIGWLHHKDVTFSFNVNDIGDEDEENIQNVTVNISFIPPLEILVKRFFQRVESSGAMPLEEFKQRLGVDIVAA